MTAYDKEPTFKSDMLIFDDRYYIIGDEHKEFTADKMNDPDYYILTLAGIARELNIRGMTSADVFLAAGLPLTWVSEQKDSFKAYLLQNKEASFSFRGKSYHVTFAGAAVFPQGFSAVADRLREFNLSRRAHLLTAARRAAVVSLPVVGPCALPEASAGCFSRGGRQCRSFSNRRHCLCGWQRGCRTVLPLCSKPLSPSGTTCHPPAKTCHWQICRRDGRCIPCTVHFLLSRQKKQNRPLQGAERK